MLFALWTWTAPALAVECPQGQRFRFARAPSPEQAYNPNPSPLDLELPLPGGGKMVFRHVCVAATGYLGDVRVELGCKNCQHQEQEFIHARRQGAISGPFTLEDLPPAWRQKLTDCARQGDGRCPEPGKGQDKGFYYFIGKYEVTRYQWKLLRHAFGQGPAPGPTLDKDDALPMTDISWYEATEFAARYTEWLLKNAPQALPQFDNGRVAYLRLPTETEWEYAARGGQRISDLAMNQEDLFPLEGRPLREYTVYSGKDMTNPQQSMEAIGSRCANPLGLYDTMGNASEMVASDFHFILGQRQHGTAGGFVIKGGCFKDNEEQVLPGRREEMPFFLAEGPYRNRFLGLRLVISAIVTPGSRNQKLQDEWKELSKNRYREVARKDDPLQEVERLIAATSNPAEKENLRYLGGVIKSNNVVINQMTEESARGVIRSAIFIAESIHNFDKRKNFVEMQLKKTKDDIKAGMTSPDDAQYLKMAEAAVKNLALVINETLNFYLSRVKEATNYPAQLFDAQMASISQEFKGDDATSRTFRRQFEHYRRHVEAFRARPGSLQRELVLKDLTNKQTP